MVNPRTIDLNSDLGEGFGRWSLGNDEALIGLITSANIACGFHAGDFSVMDRLVRLCRDAGVAIGAQPGYPDLQGFGRRAMMFSPQEVEQLVLYQIGALHAFCRAHAVELQHVKPHGALYNQAATDSDLAAGIARGVRRFSRSVPLIGLAGSAFGPAAAEAGIVFLPEAFADRRYNSDGTLQSRSIAGSVITDPGSAAEQALRIARDHQVIAGDGAVVEVQAMTICFHGDTPDADVILARARSRLLAAGFTIAPPSS